jgi:hypothetical protein
VHFEVPFSEACVGWSSGGYLSFQPAPLPQPGFPGWWAGGNVVTLPHPDPSRSVRNLADLHIWRRISHGMDEEDATTAFLLASRGALLLVFPATP